MRSGSATGRLSATAALVAAVVLVSLISIAGASVANDVPADLSTVDVAAASQAVADELSDPKYRLGTPWWERLVEFLSRAWVRFLEWAYRIADVVGGPLPLALMVGGALAAVAVAVTANLGKRRARMIDERIRREHRKARGLDPADLEREARTAEKAGDHLLAFRLLFRAALLRLDDRGLIDLRPGTTTGTVAEGLGSESFHRLVARFDAVVYGGRTATADDPTAVRGVVKALLEREPV